MMLNTRPSAPWKDIYEVGEPSLDNQRKQILLLVGEMVNAVNGSAGQAQVKSVLERLAAITNTHFQHEERIMQTCGYPDLANHKTQHDQMRRSLEGYRENLGVVTAQDMSRLLKSWWTNHFQTEDQCYVPYLSAALKKGVKLP